jgi:rRNA processing protein Gar1
MEQKIYLFHQKFFLLMKKSLLKIIMISTVVLLTASLSAQNTRVIRGKVVDEQNNPIIGATIVIKDTPAIGTVTDINGNFPEVYYGSSFDPKDLKSVFVTIL